MNVLYHHRTRGADVEGVHIRGIVNALRQLGHTVDLVQPPNVDIEKSRVTKAAPTKAKLEKKTPKPSLLFEAAEMGYNAYALPRLEARLRTRPYGMIYERYALFCVAGTLAAQRHDLPLILEVNDSAMVNRIRPLKLQAAARRVERFVWRRADAIVTITHYFRDLILEAGVDPARVFVIPNAVDDAAFGALPDGEAVRARHGLDGKITVGYVGAINFWRRVDLLVRSFAELAREHEQARLVLIGDGPDAGGVRDLARELGIGDRVVLTGKVPHAQIPEHLAALDVAVIPHSNTYGSPMKLFEYMAAGRIVVAPWLPPIVSVIGEDDGGLLFPPLDGKGLTSALAKLLADAALREKLGARAREKVMSDYVWKRHAQTILDIHRGVRA